MYDSLKEVYTSSLGKLYDRDLRGLFNAAREKIGGKILSSFLFLGKIVIV